MKSFLVVAVVASCGQRTNAQYAGSCAGRCGTIPPPPPPPMYPPPPPLFSYPMGPQAAPASLSPVIPSPMSLFGPSLGSGSVGQPGPYLENTYLWSVSSFPNTFNLNLNSGNQGAFLGSIYGRHFGMPYAPYNPMMWGYNPMMMGGYNLMMMGGYNPMMGYPMVQQCACDSSCALRGQCCYDYSSLCAASPTSAPPTAQAPTAQAPTAQAPTAQAPTAQAPTAQASSQPTVSPSVPTMTSPPPTASPTTPAPTPLTTRLFYPGVSSGKDKLGVLYSVDPNNLGAAHASKVLHGTTFNPYEQAQAEDSGFVCCDLQERMIGVLDTAAPAETFQIFAFDPKTHEMEVLYTSDKFHAYNGYVIEGPKGGGLMVNNKKGYLGYTRHGGVNNHGVVFYFDLDPQSPTYLELIPVYEMLADPQAANGIHKASESGLYMAGPPQQGPGDEVLLNIAGGSNLKSSFHAGSGISSSFLIDIKPKVIVIKPNSTDFRDPWTKVGRYDTDIDGSIYGVGKGVVYVQNSWHHVDSVGRMNMEELDGNLKMVDALRPNFKECGFPLGFYKMGVNNKRTVICEGLAATYPPLAVSFINTLGSWFVAHRFHDMLRAQIAPRYAVDSTDIGELYLQAGSKDASQYYDQAQDFSYKSVPSIPTGPQLNPSEIHEMGANYASQTILKGSTTPNKQGMVFMGAPGVGIYDTINDRYVVQRAHDGGVKGRGTIITVDRVDNSFEYKSLGDIPDGAYPWGVNFEINNTVCGWMAAGGSSRVEETTTKREKRGRRFSLYCYDDKTGTFENHENAIYQQVEYSRAPVTGVNFKGNPVGMTSRFQCKASTGQCEIDHQFLDFHRGTTYRAPSGLFIRYYKQRYSFNPPIMEPKENSAGVADEIYVANDETVFCWNGNFQAFNEWQGSFSFLQELPVKGLTYHADTDKLYLPVKHGYNSESSIWVFAADCIHPKLLQSYIVNITSTPSTKMISTSARMLYFGTMDGKMMKFDPLTNLTSTEFDFATVSLITSQASSKSPLEMLGEMTEDHSTGTNAVLYGFIGIKDSDMVTRVNKFFIYKFDTVTKTATVEKVTDSYALIGNPHPGMLLRKP